MATIAMGHATVMESRGHTAQTKGYQGCCHNNHQSSNEFHF
jgi:hypothetical protein